MAYVVGTALACLVATIWALVRSVATNPLPGAICSIEADVLRTGGRVEAVLVSAFNWGVQINRRAGKGRPMAILLESIQRMDVENTTREGYPMSELQIVTREGIYSFVREGYNAECDLLRVAGAFGMYQGPKDGSLYTKG